MISLLDNALLQGLSYGVATLGVAWAFRVLRFPDLTGDGSFLVGAAVYAAALSADVHWTVGLVLAAAAGAVAGAGTALLHFGFRVNRLLSGILISMIAYSVAFHVLDGKSNVGLYGLATLLSGAEALDKAGSAGGLHVYTLLVLAAVAAFAVAAVGILLRSDLGLLLRTAGANPQLAEALGRRPTRFLAAGLVGANALVGLAGAVVASHQGFVDVNMSIGLIITLIAALIIGEELGRVLLRLVPRSTSSTLISPFLGTVLYFLLYLAVLRGSIHGWFPIRIQPTDLKALSAVVVVLAIGFRRRDASQVVPGSAMDF